MRRASRTSKQRVRPAARANQSLATADEHGDVCVYAHRSADVIIDEVGEFTPGATGSFQPAVSHRLLDTRSGRGGWKGVLTSGQTIDTRTAMAGVVEVGTLTAVEPIGPGFVSAWSGTGAVPESSSLNFLDGEVIPNSIAAEVGPDGRIGFHGGGSGGHGYLLFDVTGWFRPG